MAEKTETQRRVIRVVDGRIENPEFLPFREGDILEYPQCGNVRAVLGGIVPFDRSVDKRFYSYKRNSDGTINCSGVVAQRLDHGDFIEVNFRNYLD